MFASLYYRCCHEEGIPGPGYMTRLLETSSRDMYQAGEPFTFLMPAAEGIYYPHGFRFVYGQSQIDGEIQEKEEQRPEVCCQVRQAEERDCGRIAAFAERSSAGCL